MPFCPTCRQEFESFAAACLDCGVELVATLAAPQAQRAVPDALVAIAALDERAAAAIAELLTAAAVPHRLVPSAGDGLAADAVTVLLPDLYGKGVVRALDSEPGLLTAEAPAAPAPEGLPWLAAYRSAEAAPREVIQDPPLLREPLERLRELGPAIHPELVSIVARGDETARRKAIRALLRLAPETDPVIASGLPLLAAEARPEPLYELARALRDVHAGAEIYRPLVALVADPRGDADADAKVRALHVIGRSERLELGTALVPLLQDEDELVREAADEALCSLTDRDLGFDPTAPAAERAPYLPKWETLLASLARG
jgi:hypothetical protein